MSWRIANPMGRGRCRFMYVIGQVRTGGSERQLYYLLRGLDRSCYQPALTVWSFSEDDFYVPYIRALEIPLHSFPSSMSGAAKILKFRHLVRKLKPEIVHSYSLYTNLAAYWAARGSHTVAIGSVRGDFAEEVKNAGPWLGRLSSFLPRLQICNSYSAAERIRSSRSLVTPPRILTIRNGVDMAEFRWSPPAMNGKAQIAAIGSLLPVKRWDRLLRASVELKRRGIDCRIRIAGDGPLRQDLREQADQLNLANDVAFVGEVADVAALLADATFLVHTSESEGCPNVVMEAMACGRAVVATAVGDIPHLVEDGRTGFVVTPGDGDKLVERMAELIADRHLCERMGRAGRAKAEREFALDQLVSKTLTAYREAGWCDS